MVKRERPGLMTYLRKRLGSETGTGPEYRFFCPFCIDRVGDESSKRKLGFNESKSAFHCFRCGYGTRNLERFFRALNGGGLRFDELALIKGETQRVENDTVSAVRDVLFANLSDGEDRELQAVTLPDEMVPLTQCKWEAPKAYLRRGVNYLKRRGVSFAAVQRYDIGYCPDGRYSQRLVFPVYQRGVQVYFTTRYCGDGSVKSLNPIHEDGFHRTGTCILNYDSLVGAKTVLLVEGPFDMMAFSRAGALLGKAISETQVRLLIALAQVGTTDFVVCLDSDAAEDTVDVYRRLCGRVPRVRALVLEHGDPWDRRSELDELLRMCEPVTSATLVKSRMARKKYRKIT